MFIRYRHARNTFVGVTAASVLGGLGYAVTSDAGPADTPAAAVAGSASAAPVEPLRGPEVNRLLMRALTTAASPHTKKKDALGSGAPVKVNLYEDTGDRHWDRMKVDEDRDGHWDSRWSFKGGQWVKDGSGTVLAEAPARERRRGGDLRTARARVLGATGGRAEPHTKKKDVLGGGAPMKVNLYEDTGDRQWDRAKIDFDRDGSWDEKWSFKDGRWETGGEAVAALLHPAAKATPKTREPAAGAGAHASEGVPPDELARLLLKDRATAKKRKDVSGGQGAKVNLYDDDQDGHWDRAKVDANRDGTWDEKWTVKGGVVERKQEVNGKVFVWHDGTWREKK